MSLFITLPPELEARLRRRAADAGKDAGAFAAEAIEEKLRDPPTLDEILQPFRQQVRDSGMSDTQLDDFYENLRNEFWREQQRAES